MDPTTMVTVSVTVTLALLGYALTYRSNLRIEQRKARLTRVNEQLGRFYGPLFALSHSGEIAWRAFRTGHRRGEPFWSTDVPASHGEQAEFRDWMVRVFMPNNRLIRAVIVNGADLLEEEEMPDCLLSLLAHISSYEVVLGRWEQGDLSVYRAAVDFPGDEVAAYSGDAFRRLKAEQRLLLGLVQDQGSVIDPAQRSR